MKREYSLIAVTLDLKQDAASMAPDELERLIGLEGSSLLQRAVLMAKEHEAQPWTLVSHDLKFVGRTLILSLLIHRQL